MAFKRDVQLSFIFR